MDNRSLVRRCNQCHKILSISQRMSEGGGCPLCGYLGVRDVADTYKEWITYITPWWKFWERPRRFRSEQ